MATAAKPQDLPPPGGYKKIHYARVPPKTYFSGKINIYIKMWQLT